MIFHYVDQTNRGAYLSEGPAAGGGGTVAEAHLRAGAPTDEILDFVEELRPGLLVAGSRGLGPIKHLILGSLSEALVHHNHAMTP